MIVIKTIKEMKLTQKEKEKVLTQEIETNEKIIEKLQKEINDYKKELEKLNKKFVPHLQSDTETHYGIIGKETNLTALFGEKLYVGDVVEYYDIESGRIFNKQYICEQEDGKAFAMGLAFHTTDMKNGVIQHYQIRKVKSYKELTHNERYGYIEAILKEED